MANVAVPKSTKSRPSQSTAYVGLVNPRSTNGNVVIAGFLSEPNSAYYDLTFADQTIATLTSNLLVALTEQGFGNGAGQAFKNASDAGRAVGAALRGVSVFVLDALDHLYEDPSDWLGGLLETKPPNTRVVLNARQFINKVWRPLIADGVVTVVGEQELSAETLLGGAQPHLNVNALGIGATWYEGKLVTRWDGPLTRRLFYFLLDRGPVNRTTIFGTFWPGLPIREATNVFHVTKRKMNETIGEDVTDYVDRHYRIGTHVNLHYDVADFENALKEAEDGSGEESIQAWQRAIEIYRHPFLMEESMEWVKQRRAQLQEGYAQALVSMARIYMKQNNQELALNHYLRALREAPLREDLHLQVMKLYADAGDRQAAIDQYERLSNRLQETLGIGPGREATQLYSKLNRG